MSLALPWAARIAHDNAALREGVQIVRKVIARDAVKTGLTTTEIYKLSLREPPPPTFSATVPSQDLNTPEQRIARSGRRRIPPPEPPHPRHPVRSISFLKHHILPRIEGEKYVQHVREIRTVARTAKGPARGPKQPSSKTSPTEAIVWLWRAARPPAPRAKAAAPRPPIVYDYSHMKPSKRKAHRAREELAAHRAVLVARREKIKASARRQAQAKVRAQRRKEGRARHEAAERAGLAAKALKREAWEAKNPKLAKQRAEADKKLARTSTSKASR